MDEDIGPVTAAHRHEVLHLAYVVGDMFGRHLLDHRAVQSDPVLLAKAEHLIELLGDFYQAIGNVAVEDEDVATTGS